MDTLLHYSQEEWKTKMKIKSKILISTLLCATFATSAVFCDSGTTFTVYSNNQAFPSSALKMGKTGRILAPVKNVFQPHGFTTQYNKATKLITVTSNDRTIVLSPNSGEATVRGSKLKLSAPVQTINGITYVPFADITKLSDTKFEWDLNARTISINNINQLTQNDSSLPNQTGVQPIGNYNEYGAVNYTYTKVNTHSELATKATMSSDTEVILLSNKKVIKTIKDFGAFYLSDMSSELDSVDDIIVLDHINKTAYGLR